MSDPRKKKDDLADALAALAAGEHVEEPVEGSGMEGHAQGPVGEAPTAPTVPVPPAPAGRAGGSTGTGAPKPAAPRSGAPVPRTSGVRPVAGDAGARGAGGAIPVSGPRGAVPGKPVIPSKPAVARPAVPAVAKVVTPPRPASGAPSPAGSGAGVNRGAGAGVPARPMSPHSKARPSAPPAHLDVPITPDHNDNTYAAPPEAPVVDHAAEVAAEAEAVGRVVEDDDTLNVPAAPAESIGRRRPVARPTRELMSRTVGFKQTLIPILLTMGVMLPGLGGYCLMLGDESPLVNAVWIPWTLVGMGAVMLVFAGLTMLQVKHQLDQQGQQG